jgi:hypothetical protein
LRIQLGIDCSSEEQYIGAGLGFWQTLISIDISGFDAIEMSWTGARNLPTASEGVKHEAADGRVSSLRGAANSLGFLNRAAQQDGGPGAWRTPRSAAENAIELLEPCQFREARFRYPQVPFQNAEDVAAQGSALGESFVANCSGLFERTTDQQGCANGHVKVITNAIDACNTLKS